MCYASSAVESADSQLDPFEYDLELNKEVPDLSILNPARADGVVAEVKSVNAATAPGTDLHTLFCEILFMLLDVRRTVSCRKVTV